MKRKYFVLMVVCLGKKLRVMKSGDMCAVPVGRRQGGEVGRRKKHKGLGFILILHKPLKIPSELF